MRPGEFQAQPDLRRVAGVVGEESWGKNSWDFTPQQGQSIVRRMESMVGMVVSGPALVVSGQRYVMRP